MSKLDKEWPPYMDESMAREGWLLPCNLPHKYRSLDTTSLVWFFERARSEIGWYWREKLSLARRKQGIQMVRMNLEQSRTELLRRNPKAVRQALKRFGLSVQDLHQNGVLTKRGGF